MKKFAIAITVYDAFSTSLFGQTEAPTLQAIISVDVLRKIPLSSPVEVFVIHVGPADGG